MGISNLLYEKYNELNLENKNLELLELGDQEIVYGEKKGKRFREEESSNFKEWKTLDLHSRKGVYIKDLSILDKDFKKFDIITNFGTSEHVEAELGHYNCWVNIHNWTKKGGYSIHEIPEAGSWKDHCRFYYTIDFFRVMKKIGYEIKKLELNYYEDQGNLIFCVLYKKEDKDFISYEDFYKNIVTEDISSSIIAKENNPKGLIF
jgi:hypothetical protein